MFTTCIYKFLWQLLYYFVSLYELCLWLRLRIIAFALWSYDLCRTPAEREQNEQDFLQHCKKHLNKIPKHLNLIIGPENTEANDGLLTRIFFYALHMNINCVSYYDTRYTNENSLKSRINVLEKLKCPEGWRKEQFDRHHAVWYICKDQISNGTNKIKNGITSLTNNSVPIVSSSNIPKSTLINGHLSKKPLSSSTSSLEIYEIEKQNNRQLLAQVCRDLFKQRHTTEIQNLLEHRSLLTERINQELSHHLGNFTEPELSIIFDDNLCTFGMLPWHTRFTEFHRHPKGKVFDVKTFAHILYKYSRCEQRWGK